MGLLSDILIARLSPTVYRDRQQQQYQEQAQGLLSEYSQQMPQGQQGQAQPGLLDPGMRQQMYDRMATIPGYEQLATQGVANLGAGQRNTENNAAELAKAQWLNNNISAQAQGQLTQQQPYVDAGVAQRYASAGASDASAARTWQGAGFDAQLQPGKMQGQQLSNLGLLNTAQNYRTPEELQAMQVETAAMKAQDTARAAVQEKNVTTDSWNSMVDDYTALSTKARGGITGLTSGTEAATIGTKRTQLVYALAKEMSGGNAEPNPAVIEQANQLVPELGFGGRDEVFKARMAALKRKPRAVPAGSTSKPPEGFTKKVN